MRSPSPIRRGIVALRLRGRRLTAAALRPLAHRPALFRRSRALLGICGIQLEAHDLLPVGMPIEGVLLHPGPAISSSVRTPGRITSQAFAPPTFPPIGYRILEDAVVTARSSGALSEAGAFRRRPVNAEDLVLHPGAVPRIRAHSGEAAVSAWRATSHIDAALMLCGMWSDNYYHWLTEYLPVLWASRRLPEDLGGWPILVSEDALRLPAARETLDILGGASGIVMADPRRTYRVGRLAIIDPLKLVEARLVDGVVGEHLGEAMHAEAMRAYRSWLMQELGLGADCGRSRIRIVAVRPRGASRPDNQDQVVRRLAQLGFQAVDAGRLSVREQAEVFNRAEMICGPAGAAMTNLIFAEAPARAVVWGAKPIDLQRGWWSNLAELGGVEVTHIPFRSDWGDPTRGLVDPEAVVRALSEAIDR